MGIFVFSVLEEDDPRATDDSCHVEELALPTCAIQLSDEVLSTDEAASAELHKAEAAHWARNSCRLLKAAITTPGVCLELDSLGQECNKHL